MSAVDVIKNVYSFCYQDREIHVYSIHQQKSTDEIFEM